MRNILTKLFKFRQWEILKLFRLIFTVYLFQRGRWELGITVDINGTPLYCFNFIFIYLEIEYYTKQQEIVDKRYKRQLEVLERWEKNQIKK